jgi:hypothetical protein
MGGLRIGVKLESATWCLIVDGLLRGDGAGTVGETEAFERPPFARICLLLLLPPLLRFVDGDERVTEEAGDELKSATAAAAAAVIASIGDTSTSGGDTGGILILADELVESEVEIDVDEADGALSSASDGTSVC